MDMFKEQSREEIEPNLDMEGGIRLLDYGLVYRP